MPAATAANTIKTTAVDMRQTKTFFLAADTPRLALFFDPIGGITTGIVGPLIGTLVGCAITGKRFGAYAPTFG